MDRRRRTALSLNPVFMTSQHTGTIPVCYSPKKFLFIAYYSQVLNNEIIAVTKSTIVNFLFS